MSGLYGCGGVHEWIVGLWWVHEWIVGLWWGS